MDGKEKDLSGSNNKKIKSSVMGNKTKKKRTKMRKEQESVKKKEGIYANK